MFVPGSGENLPRTDAEYYDTLFWELVNTKFAPIDGEDFWPERSLQLATVTKGILGGHRNSPWEDGPKKYLRRFG